MDLGNSISLLFCIPFLGMLLSIAVFPLVKPAWWERNQKYAVIAFCTAQRKAFIRNQFPYIR